MDNRKTSSLIYPLTVVMLAVAVALFLAVSGQLHWSLTLILLTVACIISEWQVIRLPQGDSLTLSIIFILLALLFSFEETTPARQAVGALQVIAVGSLVGYGLTQRPPILHLAFYVAHHVLATAIAGLVFVWLSSWLPYWPLESFHAAGIASYVVIFSVASMLLVSPVNKRIVQGKRLPTADILYTVFLAPIALIVYYFFDTRELDIISLLILSLPLIGVLVTFGLYVNIDTTYGEISQLYRISREFVAAMSQDETVQKISDSIAQALSELILNVHACLVYAHNAAANEYLLTSLDGDARAPRVIVPGHGLLGRSVTRATGTVVNDVTLEDALNPEERQWPPKTALLVHPMYAEQQNVGLLVLIRQGKGFTSEEYRLVSIVANQAGVTLHNAQMFEQSKQMADTDRKLGVLNQAAFTQQSERVFGRSQLTDEPVAVLLGDIDDFRKVNNAYGHQTGDRVLVGVASLMKEVVGSNGFVGRWGGEEFAVTLPNIDDRQAYGIADEIRQRVQDSTFLSDEEQQVQATISIGVAVFPRDAGDFLSLHKQADRAAYLAKKTGKNRVCLYEDRKEFLELVAQESPAALASPVVQE